MDETNIVDSQEEVTEPQTNEDEFSDSSEVVDEPKETASKDVDEKVAETQEESSKPKQTKKQNSEFAHQRREREAKQREEAAYYKGLKEALGDTNPYTGEKMTDDEDLKEYLIMREAEKAGLDPVNDFSKYQKQKAREKSKLESEKFNVEKDIQDFTEKYPEVDLQELIKDKEFSDFAEDLAQKIPMATIYKKYMAIKNSVDSKAKHEAENLYKKKIASPGSLSSGSGTSAPNFAEMSDAEFDKYYEKALRGELKL